MNRDNNNLNGNNRFQAPTNLNQIQNQDGQKPPGSLLLLKPNSNYLMRLAKRDMCLSENFPLVDLIN